MKVILDNGHGAETKGKRSPKGLLTSPRKVALYEYEFNRDIVCRLMKMLKKEGIKYFELVPEKNDVSLFERCERANNLQKLYKDCFLVSIHANAGGGTGWEIFTSIGETESDNIAEYFFSEAAKEFPEFRMRKDVSDGDNDKESQFYILRNTICPAVLTENFFMDHQKDLAFIMSDEGRERIAKMHFKAIVNYINSHE